MPFISEAASAIKSRFGFSNPSESVRATPDVSAKSSFRENLSHYSAVRSISDRDESSDTNNNSSSELAVRSFELPEDPSFWKDHNVQVIIRLRPLSSSEISLQGHSRCVRQESNQTITWNGHPETRFTFDVVADENVSQENLFKVAGVPMVENCVSGYNSCMFAYGQTGSGKTHTMLGDMEGGTRRHSVNCGMTPRVFEHLFSRIQKEKEARRDEKLRFTCKCSFLEIYNEHILDLLSPSSCNLQIREDFKKGVYVENLTELEVSSARDVMQQLLQGAANRTVAATNMNRASSRSHSVFTCIIESSWESQGVTHHRFARLNLVDLAGSERQKSSGAEGERLKEATNINKSLSTLGLVIMNLVSVSNGKSHHIPYRDSKLTFLLQDSLGGNSKTIIIANISPSISCSLETLSTLKFAQRAKFIKNNAIVNEDASGDVLAMRMQIQQLKKEVSHLRGLVGGGSSAQDGDNLAMGLLGSPAAYKWEGLNGSTCSPLSYDQRLCQKKEYEVALVGAFRREKDKDLALQALTAENQAAVQLAKQREDEIKGLKMRLKFRESGIKRLEAVASGKMSAEAHLLKEKEDHLKEIEVLQAQVDRNPEATRFAMENLRLKEEIRRLKSFCEEGERERMNAQISMLQNKLLEALDWKLMNEPNSTTAKKATPAVHSDSNALFSSKEQTSPWQAAIDEENEFLRLQAIHNQSEIDLLRKNLDNCLDEKQKLERHIKELEAQMEVNKSTQDTKEEDLVPQVNMNSIPLTDQMELKAMVDAIAAASQREAEAHEMAITLSRENDELRRRVKVLIEDNNKLIDWYERAVTELSNKNNGAAVEGNTITVSAEQDTQADRIQGLEHQLADVNEENEKLMGLFEKAMQERGSLKEDTDMKIKDLEDQVVEMHEENDKLMSLYEKAMQERGSLKKDADMKVQGLEDQIAEMHEENDKLMSLYEKAMQERGSLKKDADMKIKDLEDQVAEMHEEHDKLMSLYEKAMQERDDLEKIISSGRCRNVEDQREYGCPENFVPVDGGLKLGSTVESEGFGGPTSSGETEAMEIVMDGSSSVMTELDKVQEKLSNSTQWATKFGIIEESILEVDGIFEEIEETRREIHANQQGLESHKLSALEIQKRGAVMDKKFSALKFSLSNFCSSFAYFEQRELKARGRVDSSSLYLHQKKEKLTNLRVQKGETEAAHRKSEETVIELRSILASMESKLDEENKKRETEKILFAIDSNQTTEKQPINAGWKLGIKATELLKSEEEKTKLQGEINQCQAKLNMTIKETEDSKRRLKKIEAEIQRVSADVQKGSQTQEQMESALSKIISEKQMLVEIKENGKIQIDEMVVEYQQCVFEAHLNDEGCKALEAEKLQLSTKLERLESDKAKILKRMSQQLHEEENPSRLQSEKMKEELEEVCRSLLEAKQLLGKSR